MLAALAGSDRKAALALVTDLMSIAGTTNVGGRTVAEIADRFLEQSTLKGGALPRDALAIIKRFLAIAGDPDKFGGATARLGIRRETRPRGCDRSVRKPRRLHGRARHRHRPTRFSTSFGRGLDYYTGFEFELHAKATASNRWSRAAAMTG